MPVPQLENVVNNSIALKPYTFRAGQMTASNGNLSISIPGIVFSVFNQATGIAYGDIEYVSDGENGSHTVLTIENYEYTDIVREGDNQTQFKAMSFVLANGEPVMLLDEAALPVQ